MKPLLSVFKIIITVLTVGFTIAQFSSCIDNGPPTLCNQSWNIEGPDELAGCDQKAYVVIDDSGGDLTQFAQWSVSGDIQIVSGPTRTTALDTFGLINKIIVTPNFIEKETGSGTITFSGMCQGDNGTMVNTVFATKDVTIQKVAPFSWSGSLCLNSSGKGEGLIHIIDVDYVITDDYHFIYTPTGDYADLTWLDDLTIQVKNFSDGGLGGLEFAIRKNNACNNDLVWVDIPTPTQSCH